MSPRFGQPHPKPQKSIATVLMRMGLCPFTLSQETGMVYSVVYDWILQASLLEDLLLMRKVFICARLSKVLIAGSCPSSS